MRVKPAMTAGCLGCFLEPVNCNSSFCSIYESMRLRSISSFDLVGIVGFIFDIPENMAAKKAEEFIDAGKNDGRYPDREPQDSRPSITSSGAMRVCEPTRGYLSDAKTEYAEPALISDMLEVLTGLIADFYKTDPKEAVFALNSLIKSMQCDPVFTMSVIGIPFFAIKTLGADERKEVFADILSVLKKHAATE